MPRRVLLIGLFWNAGRKLTLSSQLLGGFFAPSISAQVAKRSFKQMVLSFLLPGWMRAGQLARNGTRWPPSQSSVL